MVELLLAQACAATAFSSLGNDNLSGSTHISPDHLDVLANALASVKSTFHCGIRSVCQAINYKSTRRRKAIKESHGQRSATCHYLSSHDVTHSPAPKTQAHYPYDILRQLGQAS